MSAIRLRAALLGAFTCAAVSSARGQRLAPPIAALDHTVWTIRDGAPSNVLALAQSADGVLWLGSATGLYRFDGVGFEAFEPAASQQLPSLVIAQLLALPDSTLWIGYLVGGVSVVARGRVVSYGQRDGLPEGTINALARDSTGDVWAATTTGLARLHDGRWQRLGAESGYPGGMTSDLLVDRRGTLWAPTNAGVFILRRGATRFVRQAPSLDPEGSGAGIPREAPDGTVWAGSTRLGLTRLSDSAGGSTPAWPATERLRSVNAVMIDHHANAWLEDSLGFFRVPLGTKSADGPAGRASKLLTIERVALAGGLSGPPLEDREGNVWIPTAAGIERFRETKLTLAPLPKTLHLPALAPTGGSSIWLGSFSHPLFNLDDSVLIHAGISAIITCAYRDPGGNLWFGGPAGLWHASDGASPGAARFTRVALPDEPGVREVQAIARSSDGDLWVSIRGGRKKGVYRRHRTAWSLAPLPNGFSNEIALTVVADTVGRVWLGYQRNRLVLATRDSTRVYTDGDGMHVGSVTALLARGTRLWVGGEFGLNLFDEGQFRSVEATEPLRGISGIIETADGDVWTNGAGGVTHIDAAEVRRALDDPGYRARAERFDYHDGLSGAPVLVRPLPSAIQGTDGRLWFATEYGVSWLDPTNIKRNRLAPPVQIRAVSTAGKHYVGNRVELPARTTQLQIAYTALSLAMPDRVRFRYRLAGVDSAWADAGTRREAFYTNLGPGSYRFQVIAANEDGVWNEAGAMLDFDIPPTFTQTRAFVALIAIAVMCGAWLLALWRQRQMGRALRAQFEATLAERARVARELHDTLLGDMAGLAMHLNAGARSVSAGDGRISDIADLLSSLSLQVRHSLVEARRSVTAMRSELSGGFLPLHVQLAEAALRTFAETKIVAQVEHAGLPCEFPATVAEEVVKIVSEAMANVRNHARARTVTITCSYAPRELQVRVRDDGQGFDSSHEAPAGHWGLVGMRERAASIGARLDVASKTGVGSEVTLIVPMRRRSRIWWESHMPWCNR